MKIKELKTLLEALPESDMDLEVCAEGLSDWGDSWEYDVLGVEKITKFDSPFDAAKIEVLEKSYFLLKVFTE